MRALRRNKQLIYYALFDKKEPIRDENGRRTGEYQIKYKDYEPLYVNVSAGKGEAQTELFGSNLNYDKVLSICDMKCPIDENTVLCIDTEPDSGTYDYIVKKVLKSLNCISIAISRVDVNNAD